MPQSTRTPDSDTRSTILERAIPLFAESGFAGVSMRDIAAATGIMPASLYHHFSDKEALHLEAMRYAFADKAQTFSKALGSGGSPQDRLKRLVARLYDAMVADPRFHRLLQRELLDGDDKRLRNLVSQVFEQPFKEIAALAKEIAPQCDPHLLTISIAGLVIYHLEITPIRRFLPGYRKAHDDPKRVSEHIFRLLVHGIGETP
ncbi:MAG: TetR/AcrR family transcriptional regulator [Pseudomonadota bacterium]|nr:TetR/AcrR family transcriptional regulator [Pseudomonadota bacterium]